MKRRPIVGISVAILVLSVIIGIASLPDEVLIESSSIDNSETVPEEIILPPKEESQAPISDLTDNKNIDATKEEINALKKEIIELKNEIVQIKKDPEVSQDIPIITEEKNQTVENSQNVSQGKVITISIKDGVGSKSR